MIRIAMFAHLSEVSGAGVALVELASHLPRTEFTPTMILPGRGPLLDHARARGIEPVIIETPEESLASARWMRKLRIVRQRRQHWKSVQHFLTENPQDLAYFSSSASVNGALGAHGAKVPIVWHIHETLEGRGFAVKAKKRVITRVSNALLYASESARDAFPAPTNTPCLIAKNGVDVGAIAQPLTAAERTEIETSLGLAPDDIVVAMNGMNFFKGPDLFLEAAGVLARTIDPRVRFIIFGDPPAAQAVAQERVRRATIASPDLAKRVIFAGGRSDFGRCLRRVQIFVAPSRAEALPISVVEAMAARCCVVASAVGDLPRVLAEDRGVLIPTGRHEPLVELLPALLADESRRNELAQRAQQWALREYSPLVVWPPIFGLLKQIADARQSLS